MSRDELRDRLRAAAVMLADALAEAMASSGHDARPATEAVFSVSTLAKFVHRSQSTIRGWCSSGVLQATRVRGHWFITHEAVERFLGGSESGSEARAEAPVSRTIARPADTGARPRRARANGAADVDLSAWRKVRGAGP